MTVGKKSKFKKQPRIICHGGAGWKRSHFSPNVVPFMEKIERSILHRWLRLLKRRRLSSSATFLRKLSTKVPTSSCRWVMWTDTGARFDPAFRLFEWEQTAVGHFVWFSLISNVCKMLQSSVWMGKSDDRPVVECSHAWTTNQIATPRLPGIVGCVHD